MEEQSEISDELVALVAGGIGTDEAYQRAGAVLAHGEGSAPDDLREERALASSLTARAFGALFVRDAIKPALEPALRAGTHDGSNEDESQAHLIVRWRDLDSVDDLPTLVAVARGGALVERRRALARLGERLAAPREHDAEALRHASEALLTIGSPDLAYERSLARAPLPGAMGREVRLERSQWLEILNGLLPKLAAFWEGEYPSEPLLELPGHERAILLLRSRDFPDAVIAHLGAVIEGTDGVSLPRDRISLLSSLRYAGDPRLVPSLGYLLADRDSGLVIEAAQVLSRIEDPRVLPLLQDAYERAVLPGIRIVLAGALGRCGDRRGENFLMDQLDSKEAAQLLMPLEALEGFDRVKDTSKIVASLSHEDSLVAAAAIRALARCGDAAALQPLRELRHATSIAALWGEIEDAVTAIRARIELRGEDTEQFSVSESWFGASEHPIAPRTPIVRKTRAWFFFNLGCIWLFLGAKERGLAAMERAFRSRESWLTPILSAGLYLARAGEDVRALVAFRRAYQVSRRKTEASRAGMKAIAHTFLRRAEALERENRSAIAQALLEEVLSMDLRLVPSALRFELERRYSALLRQGELSSPHLLVKESGR